MSLGCGPTHFSQSAWNPFSLTPALERSDESIRIAVLDSDEGVFDTAEWAFIKRRPPWDALGRAMTRRLGRPVYFEQLKLFQIANHLGTGRCHFALVSGDAYRSLRAQGVPVTVLLEPRTLRRQGLIVASAESDIHSIEDLAGRRFAFGPRKDPVLFYNTLEVLDRAGIAPSDLQQELVITGFDGSLQNHASSRDAAREIVYGLGTDAGVIESNEYAAFPESGGQGVPLLYTFSKDQFRGLGKTDVIEAITLPDCKLLMGEGVAPDLAKPVRSLLIAAHIRTPGAIHDLGFARFEAPVADDKGVQR